MRDGAPEEIDLQPEAELLFLTPLPLGVPYLAPILARLTPHTISTADLCASEPPAPENWTLNDTLAALNPDSYAALDAKLERMARAAVWNGVCEYVPAPDPPPGVYPRQIFEGTNGPFYATNPTEPVDWVGSPTSEGADLYAVIMFPADRMYYPGLTKFTITVDDPVLGRSPLILPVSPGFDMYAHKVLHPGDDLGGGYIFNPVAQSFVFTELPGNTTDMFCIVTGWRLTNAPLFPPPPQPWPTAPAEPLGWQFTNECAAKLCTMADEWAYTSAKVASTATLLDVAVPQLESEHVQILDAIGTNEAPKPAGDAEVLGVGSLTRTIPTSTVGVILRIAPPENVQMRFGEVPAYGMDAWATTGNGNGWDRSVRVSHYPQIVMFPTGTQLLAIDAPPASEVVATWLIPGP